MGTGKAFFTLARKIVVVIWHLLINDGVYDDGILKAATKIRFCKIPPIVMKEEMLQIIKETTVIIKKPDPGVI